MVQATATLHTVNVQSCFKFSRHNIVTMCCVTFVVCTELYITYSKLLEEPGDLILCGAPNHTEYKFPHNVALK